MQCGRPFYLEKLISLYEEKKRLNMRFSKRMFAKHLGLDSSELSAIFKQKRNLPLKKARLVADKLDLSPADSEQFYTSVLSNRKNLSHLRFEKTPDFVEVKENEVGFRIISEWEHYALLELTNVKDFTWDYIWISERLGISLNRVEKVVQNLELANVIKVNSKGSYDVHTPQLTTTHDVESKALKLAHKENCSLAESAIDNVDLLKRDLTSITFPMNSHRMPELKKVLKEFRRKILTLMKDEHSDEVYQLNLQLFPLTQQKEKEE